MKEARKKSGMFYWLKRVVVVCIVPLFTAIGVFYIFKVLPGSFSSEAKIKVQGLELKEMSEDSRERFLKNKIRPLLISMRSERSLVLISLRLFLHDATSDQPFTDKKTFEKRYSKQKINSLVIFCQAKLDNLELGFSENKLDSSLFEVLTYLRYDPASLEKRISIRRTPGTNLIGVLSKTYRPALSTYMVDQFCSEYIRYQRIVEQQRFEGSLDMLERLLAQRKADLEEKRLLLENQKNHTHHPEERKFSNEILARIGTLEIDKQEEKQRVEVLKADLIKYRDKRKKSSVVKAAYIADKEDLKKENEKKLLIELGASLAKIQFLTQQIETLRGKLVVKEESALIPFRKGLEDARISYLEVLGDLKKARIEYEKAGNSLKQVKWGKSRMKMPQGHKFMALLAGFASIFVWAIFLINIGFLTIKI